MSSLRYRAPVVDRRYNDWHYTLHRDLAYIDIDGIEVCVKCWEPLALIETTTNPEKTTTILAKLARGYRDGIPAYLILLPPVPADPWVSAPLDGVTEIRWRQISPQVTPWVNATLEEWSNELYELRVDHGFVCTRAHRGRPA